MLPADQMEKTQQRLDGFKAGHGTILFFDDEAVIRQQQEAFKLYADNFPIWANQTNVRKAASWTFSPSLTIITLLCIGYGPAHRLDRTREGRFRLLFAGK